MSLQHPVKIILISQPQPTEPNSPYFQIAEKWGVHLEFRKFIQVDGISLNDFRKQNIRPLDYTAIIFTSRVTVDHFFRLINEMRIEMPPDTKYFCVGEATSKYLQKYIVIRKRKLFVGEKKDMDLAPYIQKHNKEKFLFPCGNIHHRELPDYMKSLNMDLTDAVVYQTVSSDVKDLNISDYDMICFFSPAGVQSLFYNFPDFKQGNTRIACMGAQTARESVERGLRVDIEAPTPASPSLTAAIENYIRENSRK